MGAEELWIALRIAKWTGLALWVAGVSAATRSGDQRERIEGFWRLATPGALLTWLAGFGLMKASGRELEVWIAAGFAASLAAHHLAGITSRQHLHRPSLARACWALVGAALGAMVGRSLGPHWWIAAFAGASATTSAALLLPGVAHPLRRDPHADARLARAFHALLRAEAVSGLALMAVSMPLKHLSGVTLDGGTGLLGALHGALTILCLNSLGGVARAHGWRAPQVGAALLAILLPGGGLFLHPSPPRTPAET